LLELRPARFERTAYGSKVPKKVFLRYRDLQLITTAVEKTKPAFLDIIIPASFT
jgi:hypothetical protein